MSIRNGNSLIKPIPISKLKNRNWLISLKVYIVKALFFRTFFDIFVNFIAFPISLPNALPKPYIKSGKKRRIKEKQRNIILYVIPIIMG
jgi:hypothetical protein